MDGGIDDAAHRSGGERLDRIAAKLGSIAAVLGFDKGRLVGAILQGANTIPTNYYPEARWRAISSPPSIPTGTATAARPVC
jgi:cytochrome bd-type quinol oxidase subunit 2